MSGAPVPVLLVNTGKTAPIGLLQDDPLVRLSVITESWYADRYADGTPVAVVQDVGDLTEVRAAALGLLRTQDVRYVVGPSERSLQAAGYLRSYLGLDGDGFDVANRFSNKPVMKRRLREAGLPVADFEPLRGLAGLAGAGARLGWPVIVKPALGAGSVDTHVVADAADAARFAARHRAGPLDQDACTAIAERFLDVRAEYHCDGVVSRGEVVFAAASRYLEPVLRSVGRSLASVSPDPGRQDTDEVLKLHTAAVQALGLRDGVSHLEVLRTGEGLVIGEITCRPAGGGIPDLVRHQHGVDLWDAFVRTSTGREPRLPTRTGPGAGPGSGVTLQGMLPLANGAVEYVTPAERLLDLPGVVSARVDLRAGQTVRGRTHSSRMAGLVLVTAATEAEAEQRWARVLDAFRLVTTPEATP